MSADYGISPKERVKAVGHTSVNAEIRIPFSEVLLLRKFLLNEYLSAVAETPSPED